MELTLLLIGFFAGVLAGGLVMCWYQRKTKKVFFILVKDKDENKGENKGGREVTE